MTQIFGSGAYGVRERFICTVEEFAVRRFERRSKLAQHAYSVRFAARELWGDQAAPCDAVYIDLWDDYLEPA